MCLQNFTPAVSRSFPRVSPCVFRVSQKQCRKLSLEFHNLFRQSFTIPVSPFLLTVSQSVCKVSQNLIHSFAIRISSFATPVSQSVLRVSQSIFSISQSKLHNPSCKFHNRPAKFHNPCYTHSGLTQVSLQKGVGRRPCAMHL